MKKIKILSFLVCFAVLLSGCHKEDEQKLAVKARTILVYIAAYNSLGQSNLDSEDLQEMMVGMKNVDVNNNNLLVYLAAHGASPKLIHFGKNNKGEVIQETVSTYDFQNSVSVSVMKTVFAEAFSQYPADNYGIIFWSHGDGWIPYPTRTTRWWGQDANDGDKRMNITDLNESLSAAPHLDFIFFDACFMQSAEVIYQLRDRADYFIGSPTEIPGPGAPYDVVVPAMFSSEQSAIGIAENYYSVYNANYRNGVGLSNANWTGGVSLSVIKSSEMEALSSAVKNVVLSSTKVQDTYNIDSPRQCYDPLRKKNYYDLTGLMESIQSNEAVFNQYKDALKAAVVWKNTTENNYCTSDTYWGGYEMVSMSDFAGVSTYILNEKDSYQNQYYRQYIDWYSASGWANISW